MQLFFASETSKARKNNHDYVTKQQVSRLKRQKPIRMKNWTIFIMIILPFLASGSVSFRHERMEGADIRLPYISVSYNLRWGKQKRNLDKLINVGVDVDRSSAAGR